MTLFFLILPPESCRSGRTGRSRKPLSALRGPRVRIPYSPQSKNPGTTLYPGSFIQSRQIFYRKS